MKILVADWRVIVVALNRYKKNEEQELKSPAQAPNAVSQNTKCHRSHLPNCHMVTLVLLPLLGASTDQPKSLGMSRPKPHTSEHVKTHVAM